MIGGAITNKVSARHRLARSRFLSGDINWKRVWLMVLIGFIVSYFGSCFGVAVYYG